MNRKERISNDLISRFVKNRTNKQVLTRTEHKLTATERIIIANQLGSYSNITGIVNDIERMFIIKIENRKKALLTSHSEQLYLFSNGGNYED